MDLLTGIFKIAMSLFAIYLVFIVFATVGVVLLLYLPVALGITWSVSLWRAGNDNLAVVVAIFSVIVEFFWWPWVNKLSLKNPAKCPSCKSRNTKIIAERTRSYNTTRTETRRHTHYDRKGKEAGYSETEYEVPDTDTDTDYTRKCSSCGHVWTY